VVREFPDVFS
jgi:hypothetical protein